MCLPKLSVLATDPVASRSRSSRLFINQVIITTGSFKTVAFPVRPDLFVNRYAEAFDIFATNLPSLRRDPGIKQEVPIATQIMGTGKTVLGLNAVSVINRPRESPSDEADVISRLQTSSLLIQKAEGSRILQKAVDLPHDETIVSRALRVYAKEVAHFQQPDADRVVNELKQAQTVVINMDTISDNHPTFNTALADRIYRQVTGEPWGGIRPPSVISVAELIEEYGPLFFLYDEVAALDRSEYSCYFHEKLGEKGAFILSFSRLPVRCAEVMV